MGYTHYWTQKRNFTREEWADVHEHIGAILKDVQHIQGIALASMNGDANTSPEFFPTYIGFNGVGDDAHESFKINFKRKKEWEGGRIGGDFCKTARKPYDLAVTACLSYLSSVVETHDVTSDGDGTDWLDGVEEARRAVPRFANVLDIPMSIMKEARWCAPWVGGSQLHKTPFEIHFCIDGKGYVLKPRTRESYCFESHVALAKFLDRTKQVKFSRGGGTSWGRYEAVESNIWNSYGSFDKARHDRIARAQRQALEPLFPVDPSCAQQPPAFARPNEMPSPETPSYYSFSELLTAAENA